MDGVYQHLDFSPAVAWSRHKELKNFPCNPYGKWPTVETAAFPDNHSILPCILE